MDRRQQRPQLRFRPQRARGRSLCRVYLRHQGQVLGRGRTSRRLQSLLRPLFPHAPRPPEMEHHPLDDAPRLGRSGLPFDERHHRQYRRPGYRKGDPSCGFQERAVGICGPEWPRPYGEGPDRRRKPYADFRTGEPRRCDAELRLFPHAVLQLGRGRSGDVCRPDRFLRHRRTFVHRHLPDRLLVVAGRAARHLRHVPLYGQRNDDQARRRRYGPRGASAGEPV